MRRPQQSLFHPLEVKCLLHFRDPLTKQSLQVTHEWIQTCLSMLRVVPQGAPHKSGYLGEHRFDADESDQILSFHSIT